MIKKGKKRKQESGITSFFVEKLTEKLNLDKFFKSIDTLDAVLKAVSSKRK